MTTFRWLVHSNSLSYLEEQCDTLKSDTHRVYRLVVPLDVSELLDYSGKKRFISYVLAFIFNT